LISFFAHWRLDQRERAVGVVLSGMGSDGTLGLRAIKENAGLSMAQSPESAKFDSMPLSAIATKLVDIVGLPSDLPEKLLNFLNHSTKVPHPITPSNTAEEQIIILLRERTGNDFSLYKKNTFNRRIERRMGLHQIVKVVFYVRYLRENPQELDLLFKELLIGVTNFFRDPDVWQKMCTKALPNLLTKYPAGKEMRAWVPACSTGEEAYSLAMIFKETLEELKLQGKFSLQIFATDLDNDAIRKRGWGFTLSILKPTSHQNALIAFLLKKQMAIPSVMKFVRWLSLRRKTSSWTPPLPD